jgi:dephospho-CoA kinase
LLGPSSHWRQRVERVLVVDCDEDTQVTRVVQRSGWSDAQVRQVIAQQTTRATRRSIADAVIFNDDLSVEQLQCEVRSLWRRWAAMRA